MNKIEKFSLFKYFAAQVYHVSVRVIKRKEDTIACVNVLNHHLVQVLQRTIKQFMRTVSNILQCKRKN